jgi:hypothetical protein
VFSALCTSLDHQLTEMRLAEELPAAVACYCCRLATPFGVACRRLRCRLHRRPHVAPCMQLSVVLLRCAIPQDSHSPKPHPCFERLGASLASVACTFVPGVLASRMDGRAWMAWNVREARGANDTREHH